MATAYDLFSYPQSAGWKANGTSCEAADSINAAGLRGKVLEAIQSHGPLTADECAERLRMDRLSIRPRCTELRELGKLKDSGLRRQNASGRNAIVWNVSA